MTDKKEIIALENVSKRYTKGSIEVKVLDKFNLRIKEGEFLSIMGPSGTGKSTILNIIGGLDKPDAGTVKLEGEEVYQYASKALAKWRAQHVGFIFQAYHLIPVLTAMQNVELPLLLKDLNKSERRQRAEAALAVVALSSHQHHYPKELSGGQEQRVAIARAIVTNPEILICDEPTGGLDAATAKEILGILKILNEDYGKTIVMVTHDPVAASYASRQVSLVKDEAEEGSAS